MNNKKMISCAEQFDIYKKDRFVVDAKIENFERPNGADYYNPTIPFQLNGETYILCRTQQRTGTYSKVYFYHQVDNGWAIVPNSTSFDLEDPAVAIIDGKVIISGINVVFGDGVTTQTRWTTDFYVCHSIDNVEYLTSGPSHMKDIRLVQLQDGKIGVLTRPQGEAVIQKYGCIAKIGFTIIDKLEDLCAEVIENAPLLEDMWLPNEWGGCNYATLLSDGRLGVIGHKSYRSYDENGGEVLHYYGIAFVLDPTTRKTTAPQIIISRDCFPDCEPREERLKDITFTAGIIRLKDGYARIYTGLSDSVVGSAIIKDPFVKFDGRKTRRRKKKSELAKNGSRYALLLPAIIFIFIFAYLPMIGSIAAFQEYDPVKGIFGSKWVGLDNFKFFFSGSKWVEVTVNTLYLNVMFILTGTIASLFVAIILSELTNKIYVKVSQTFLTLPNFVSWASIALFSVAFLSSNGIINQIIKSLDGKVINFSTDPSVWRATLIIVRLWKTTGWGAIIYMAAIAGISPDMYEAARIDGANRVQCIFKITLPLLKDVIILQLLLSIGSIFRGDFGMIYPFVGDNALLFPTTDVIDTYVYRVLRTNSDFSKNMAVSLFQSVMGFAMVLVANGMVKRYSPESALF